MTDVYLDPGHGGTDPGATGHGLKEKDLTLKIAKYTRDYLLDNYSGIRVRMSRTTDKTLSLAQRTNDANKWGADYLLSIHINAFNGRANGYEDFAYNGKLNSNTLKFQDAIHKEVSKVFEDFPNRGQKRANYHMLREARASAVLTENLFIDNKKDADFLKKESNLKKIGQAHAKGIAAHIGLKKKTTSKKPSTGTTMYRVVTGSFSKKSNAESRKKALSKDGFDSFLDYHNNMYRVVTGSFSKKDNAEDRMKELKRKGFDSFIDAYKKK